MSGVRRADKMSTISSDKQVSEVPLERFTYKHARNDDIRRAHGTNEKKKHVVGITNSPPTLPPVPDSPFSSNGTNTLGLSIGGDSGKPTTIICAQQTSLRGQRDSSPVPSFTYMSSFSAATTSATFSSRSSISSYRTSSSRHRSFKRCGDGDRRSTDDMRCNAWRRSYPHPAIAPKGGKLPPPASSRYTSGRCWQRYGGGRFSKWGDDRRLESLQRWPGKDYASEAGYPRGRSRSRSESRVPGKRKRSGTSSRERWTIGKAAGGGVQCPRCSEWCRATRERKEITRTLSMEYWVRTPACKEAKLKHMAYMDKMTFSREQFIEETVFTCPFTGVQRDILLERNMFPYDVPTDVEHWTLWSREDLDQAEMEEFVEKWAAENHPHAVEWECDNNEGDRSIDWYHVHVFFRLGCEDRTGVPRDPSSAYQAPCRAPACTTRRVESSNTDSDHGQVQ